MALCTQLDVEQKLQWDITAEPDATVAALIADAQAHIEAEIGRTVESAARTETLDAGSGVLFLKWFPVTGVTSVVEDGITLTVDDDYKFYDYGKLIRMSEGDQIPWRTLNPQAVVVSYTGGYLTGIHDSELEHLGSLCAEVVARAFRQGAASAALPVGVGSGGGIQSISLEGSDTVSYHAAGGETIGIGGGLSRFVFLLDDERRQLGRYRSLMVA